MRQQGKDAAANELRTTLNGTGNMNLADQVMAQGVFINGTGDYRSFKLDSQDATVEVCGLGFSASQLSSSRRPERN